MTELSPMAIGSAWLARHAVHEAAPAVAAAERQGDALWRQTVEPRWVTALQLQSLWRIPAAAVTWRASRPTAAIPVEAHTHGSTLPLSKQQTVYLRQSTHDGPPIHPQHNSMADLIRLGGHERLRGALLLRRQA